MTKAKMLLILTMSCILFENANSQEIESNSYRERNFAFEIKHIDEFIERFNNENDAFIVKYVKENYPGTYIDRASLISNLFNRKINWNTTEVSEFLTSVNNKVSSAYLNFSNEGWYAEALCKFKYKGRLIDVVLLLKIDQTANGGLKWMIVSAYSSLIPPAKNSIILLQKKETGKFLNPMSHATNFMSLSKALNDKPSICNYLDSNFLKTSYSNAFLKALLENQLQYQFVKSITYHFLQISGWIFTVDRFQRNSVNSGWLISSIMRASERDKEIYKGSLVKKKV